MPEKKNNRQPGIRLILIALVIICIIWFMLPDDTETDDEDKFYYTPATPAYSFEWNEPSNVEQLAEETTPVAGVREKFTQIKGNGKDTVTIMVYMCGSDLEAEGGMGTYDLQEMASVDLNPNINLIVYTGGCTQWHIKGISSKYNQIFRVMGNGSMKCLVENAGTSSMMDPDNLTGFIEYCEENFEADRYELVLWDHGGGAISGYGYDLKYPKSGSLTLDKLDKALTNAGVKFDFVGFDACLMATTENALMLSEHADYMIASEETEPGIGWYYTPWLKALSRNTSLSTVEIGKTIADNFVSKCRADTPKQSATLSVVDLAEFQASVPDALRAFAKSTSDMIDQGDYKTVSRVRGASRDFGTSSKEDMVDLADMASRFDTEEAKNLKKALLGCVKYNNTSPDMTNSYGLSIFFPYRSTKYVNVVLNTYKGIDMNSEYSDCIRSFASYQASGQIASGGSHNAYQSFDSYSSDSYYSQQGSYDELFDLLSLFMNGGYSSDSGYSDYYTDGWDTLLGRGSIDKDMVSYLAENHFDADLSWKNGKVKLSDKQWELVSDLKLNMFIDDGAGYIDLGKDNVYDIDGKGNLLKEEEITWLAASADNSSWQVVPYYCISEQCRGEEVISTGRIPVLLNGKQADLIIKMDDSSIEVAGVIFGYDDTTVISKNLTGLEKGDQLEFICDYYDYDGNYSATYVLGDKLTVDSELFLGDVDIASYDTLASYEFTDIYGQSYWTDPMK